MTVGSVVLLKFASKFLVSFCSFFGSSFLASSFISGACFFCSFGSIFGFRACLLSCFGSVKILLKFSSSSNFKGYFLFSYSCFFSLLVTFVSAFFEICFSLFGSFALLICSTSLFLILKAAISATMRIAAMTPMPMKVLLYERPIFFFTGRFFTLFFSLKV